MPICIHCSSIDLIGLWTTKSPRLHKPSLLALVFSAEDCQGCEIILDSLSTRPVLGLPLPTLLEPSTPLAVATINGYKYTTAVTDTPVNIDCLLFYFDHLCDVQGVDNVWGKPDPKYPGSWLDIFSDDTATFDYIVGRPVKPILDPTIVFEWFGQCKENHPVCSQYSNLDAVHKSDFPSRLIDVSPNEGPIRLVRSAIKDTDQKYLTLSHRWMDNIVKTTQQSLCAHQERLPHEDLSEYFRDAIKITKQLGFRYIWIDALCIVQDAPAEMQSECSHMKEIYQNCTIMLAAGRTEHSSDGLYPIKQNSKEAILPFRDANGKQVSQFTLSSRRLSNFHSDVISSVLSPRGWTLQERVLAPRILHFGKSQLHWECRTSTWNERTDFKRIFYTPHVLDDAREIITAINRKNLGLPPGRDIVGMGIGCTDYTMWYDLVSDYSCRKLTFPEDRLRAILGLAEMFRRIIHDQFVWGLFYLDLPAGLLWSVQATIPMTRLAAPSWSWASIDGELTFYIPSTKWGRPLRGNLEITCDDISLADSAGLDSIYQSGRFSCRCPVKLVALSASEKVDENEEYPYDHLRHEPNAEVRDIGSNKIIGSAAIDDSALLQRTDLVHPLKLYAAMIYRQYPPAHSSQTKRKRKQISISYCILLKPLVESGLFQRSGYAEIRPETFFEVEMSNVAIV